MPRAELVETVTVPLGPGGSLFPVPGVAVIPFTVDSNGNEGGQANAFSQRTGSTPASTLVTDNSGTVSYWLDEGDYNIHVEDQQSPPRIATYIRGFSSVSGDLSTAWANLTLASGIVAMTGAYTPTARVTGDKAELRGGFTNNSGSSIGPSAIVATMPAGTPPASTIGKTVWMTSGSATQITVTPGGNMIIAGTLTNGSSVYIDGIFYSLD